MNYQTFETIVTQIAEAFQNNKSGFLKPDINNLIRHYAEKRFNLFNSDGAFFFHKKDIKDIFYPPDYNWFTQVGHPPSTKTIEYFAKINNGKKINK